MQHTEAQLDFVLEMYSADHPDEFKFMRGSEKEPLTRAEILAEWEKKLIGKERDAFLMPKLPSDAVLKKAEKLASGIAALQREIRKSAEKSSQGRR